ncbi:hypothetical protein EV182_004997, partial [Spiromyces aspiralis]
MARKPLGIMQASAWIYQGLAVLGLLSRLHNRAESFRNLSSWLEDARQHLNENTTIILVGNKSDLDAKRAVAKEEGKEFANANNLLYIETSSKTGANVEETFARVAQEIYRKIQAGEIDPNDEVTNLALETGVHM